MAEGNPNTSLLVRCRLLAQIEDEIRALRDAIDWTTCEDPAGEEGYDGSNHDSVRVHEVTCFQHTGEWATACEPCKENKGRMSEITRQKQARRRTIQSICKLVKSSAYDIMRGCEPHGRLIRKHRNDYPECLLCDVARLLEIIERMETELAILTKSIT